MNPDVRRVLREQSGTVSREQLLLSGCSDEDIRRLVRRRDLAPLARGAYVDHTGRPTWAQRAWGAVLLSGHAALSHESALRAAEGPGSGRAEEVIHVAVDRGRRLAVRDGVRVHRTAHLEERVQWHLGPPRVRYEEAVLDVAALARRDVDAVGELARAVQGGRSTALRLQAAVGRRERLPRGRWMAAVLDDVASGACSVLEHGYLTRVERAHGLATARRQVRDRIGSGTVFRDVEYDGGVVAELDGRLHHALGAGRDRDMDRDLLAALADKTTVRLSYGQVWDRACWTAACMAVLLGRRGVEVRPVRCHPLCVVLDPVL